MRNAEDGIVLLIPFPQTQFQNHGTQGPLCTPMPGPCTNSSRGLASPHLEHCSYEVYAQG
jgi:hypothetical protein